MNSRLSRLSERTQNQGGGQGCGRRGGSTITVNEGGVRDKRIASLLPPVRTHESKTPFRTLYPPHLTVVTTSHSSPPHSPYLLSLLPSFTALLTLSSPSPPYPSYLFSPRPSPRTQTRIRLPCRPAKSSVSDPEGQLPSRVKTISMALPTQKYIGHQHLF